MKIIFCASALLFSTTSTCAATKVASRMLDGGLVAIEADFNCLADCSRTAAAAAATGDCFQLTSEAKKQSGVVWSTVPLEVAESFVVQTQMYFGVKDGPAKNRSNITKNDPGADGIAFVLQNQGAATVGIQGGGLGYSSIEPSLAVEFDTYWNNGTADTLEDHVALVRDGKLLQGVLDGPYPLSINLEDGNFHNVTYEWLSDLSTVNVYMNGTTVMTSTLVDMSDILGSDFAFLGFTSSTGESSNVHQVCIESIQGTVFESPAPSDAVTVAPIAPPSFAPVVQTVPPSLVLPTVAPTPTSTPTLVVPTVSPSRGAPTVTPSFVTPALTPSTVVPMIPSGGHIPSFLPSELEFVSSSPSCGGKAVKSGKKGISKKTGATSKGKGKRLRRSIQKGGKSDLGCDGKDDSGDDDDDDSGGDENDIGSGDDDDDSGEAVSA